MPLACMLRFVTLVKP